MKKNITSQRKTRIFNIENTRNVLRSVTELTIYASEPTGKLLL